MVGRKRHLLIPFLAIVIVAILSFVSSSPAYAATTVKTSAYTPNKVDGSTMYVNDVFTSVITFESDATIATCKVSFNWGSGETGQYNGTLSAGVPDEDDPTMLSYSCTNNINRTLLDPVATYSVRFWVYDPTSSPLINGQTLNTITVDGEAPRSTLTAQITNANGADNPDWKIQMTGTVTEPSNANYLEDRVCSFRYFANNQWISAGTADATRSGTCSKTLDVSDASLTVGTYALMVVTEDAFGHAEVKSTGDASVAVTAAMLGQADTPAAPAATRDEPTVEEEEIPEGIDPADLGGVITDEGDEVDEDEVTNKGLETDDLKVVNGSEVNVRLWTVLLGLSAVGLVFSVFLMVRRGWFGWIGRRFRRGRVDEHLA